MISTIVKSSSIFSNLVKNVATRSENSIYVRCISKSSEVKNNDYLTKRPSKEVAGSTQENVNHIIKSQLKQKRTARYIYTIFF